MRLHPYVYHRPRRLDEALELLREHAGDVMPIAGGTDLVPNMKHRLFTPGHLVALKGAGTVVTDGEKVYINKTGNPGMATAGAGDVLTGAIVALACQGLSNFDATVLGVYIHGLAGDIVAERTGQVSLMATDIIESLPNAFIKT